MQLSASSARLEQFREDVALGLFGGGWIAARAAPILGIWVVGGTLWHLLDPTRAPNWALVLGGPTLIVLAFLMGAIGVGVGLFLLRPLRQWLIGWVVTGYVLGAVVYGSMGFMLAIGYQYLGVNLLKARSVEDAWDNVVPTALICGVVGALVAMMWWFQSRTAKDT